MSNLTTAHAKETPQLDPAFAATNHTATEEANSAKSTLDNTLVNDNAEKPAAEQKSLIPQSTITSSDPITPPAERDLKKTQKHLFAKHKEAPQKPLIASLRNSATHHGLLKLNSPIWVIQLGSFKNKTNAVHLVDQLRSNGYKAFIHRVDSTFGETTRVYVGPEPKQTSAKALANRLEQDMHLHGIVVSFQPLAL